MKTLLRSCALLGSLAIFGLPPLRADTIFTNINSTDCGCGLAPNGSGQALAEAFTPTGNYLLTGAAAKLLGIPSSVDFSIYSDSGGVPGSSLVDLGTATVMAEQVYSQTVSPSLELLTGQEYWLVLTQTSANNFDWDALGSSAQPYATDFVPGGNWTAAGTQTLQFSVSGNPLSSTVTPEPESLSLLLLGLIPLARHLRRGKAFVGGSRAS